MSVLKPAQVAANLEVAPPATNIELAPPKPTPSATNGQLANYMNQILVHFKLDAKTLDECETHVLTSLEALVEDYLTNSKKCKKELCYALLSDKTLSSVYSLNDEGLKCPNYKANTQSVVNFLTGHLENDDDLKVVDVMEKFAQGQFVPEFAH